jgi:BirA family biotin operon repressor/biotin-[acetyl-CoA-carboxylase] ligase
MIGETLMPVDESADTRLPGGSPRWTVRSQPTVPSTQALARGCPAWTAIVARAQTAGCGQAARSFVSDEGGLYLTAVLPFSGDASGTRGFALAVGWAVRETLRRVGVRRLRLRWPNDLMVGPRKVGGILVEQDGRDTLLVGLGLNVTNRPWLVDPALGAVAGRLADAVEGGVLPERERLVELILRAIRVARRLAGFAPVLNRCWGRPRGVELDPVTGVVLPASAGRFHGIDEDGRVLLWTGAAGLTAIPAHQIGRLREVAEPE